MPVFLSHKKEDTAETVLIENYLRSRGVKCYLDAFDPELSSAEDITSTLMEKVGACTHIMAVVSSYTKESWWVPFEIGVASEGQKRITSYQLSSVKLPDFLTKWPVLSSPSDLAEFVRYYKSDKTVALEERGYFDSVTISSADQFHRQLKSALRQ